MTTKKEPIRYATSEEAMPIVRKIINDNPETLKLLGGGRGCKGEIDKNNPFNRLIFKEDNQEYKQAHALVKQQLLDAFAQNKHGLSWEKYSSIMHPFDKYRFEELASLASSKLLAERSVHKTAIEQVKDFYDKRINFEDGVQADIREQLKKEAKDSAQKTAEAMIQEFENIICYDEVAKYYLIPTKSMQMLKAKYLKPNKLKEGVI